MFLAANQIEEGKRAKETNAGEVGKKTRKKAKNKKKTSGKENVKEYGKLDRKRAESCASRDDLVKKKKKGNVFGWRAQAYQREAAK